MTGTPPDAAERPEPTEEARRKSRRTLLLIALVSVAPIVASYTAYYFFRHDATTNYGALLPVGPAPVIEGAGSDGAPFRLSDLRGKWVLLSTGGGACSAACERKLYATRQARTMQGREQERIARVWLVDDDAAPAKALVESHPGLVVARVPPAALAGLPGGPGAIYLIDPLGNLVLRYPDDPDIKGVSRDLTRLLKASRIG
jgi:hypothetical protein